MARQIAPRDLYGFDGAGVRRFVRAGSLVPPGLRLEEPLPEAPAPAELQQIERNQARRRNKPDGPKMVEDPLQHPEQVATAEQANAIPPAEAPPAPEVDADQAAAELEAEPVDAPDPELEARVPAPDDVDPVPSRQRGGRRRK